MFFCFFRHTVFTHTRYIHWLTAFDWLILLQQSASGLGIDQNLQRYRAVSLRQHGFLVYSVLIWWPMCITLHFSGWNLKSHVCDQDINLFRSSCRPKESSLVLIRHQILVSSANILMLLMIQVGNSFTNSRNRRGPRTDPWGTPLNTAAQLDNLPLTLTAISLFVTRSQAVARIADRTGYLVISNCCKIQLFSKYSKYRPSAVSCYRIVTSSVTWPFDTVTMHLFTK